VIRVRDQAESLRVLAKASHADLEIQQRAAEFKLRVERILGTRLRESSLRGGNHRSNDHPDRLSLSDYGITQNDSTRCQLIASVPEDVFEHFIAATNQTPRGPTRAGLLRLAKQLVGGGGPNRRSKSARHGKPGRSTNPTMDSTSPSSATGNQLTTDTIEILRDVNRYLKTCGSILDSSDTQLTTEKKLHLTERYLRQMAESIRKLESIMKNNQSS
jgi:hypothetical protein